MATTEDRAHIAQIHTSGCFSRPEEPQEAYLQQSSSWTQAQPDSGWEYPQCVVKIFAEQFAVDLKKIPVEISANGLMPWELACCWIDSEGHAAIQIRPQDKTSRLVQAEALLTHEAVHAVRGRLFSSIFEEHCAYAACRKAFPQTFPLWRTFLGPLFTSPREVAVILCLIWGTWGLPMLFDWDVSFPVLLCLSLSYLIIPFVRLVTRWTVWRKALKNIAAQWPHKEWKLIIRLSDAEVIWLSQLNRTNLREAVQEKARQEWRWAYFLDELLE